VVETKEKTRWQRVVTKHAMKLKSVRALDRWLHERLSTNDKYLGKGPGECWTKTEGLSPIQSWNGSRNTFYWPPKVLAGGGNSSICKFLFKYFPVHILLIHTMNLVPAIIRRGGHDLIAEHGAHSKRRIIVSTIACLGSIRITFSQLMFQEHYRDC
jgi:hypothetical protein